MICIGSDLEVNESLDQDSWYYFGKAVFDFFIVLANFGFVLLSNEDQSKEIKK